MSGERKVMRCEDVSPLLVFFTCDELTAGEREQIVAHLANCGDCSAQLAQEDALHDAIERIRKRPPSLTAPLFCFRSAAVNSPNRSMNFPRPKLTKAGSHFMGAPVDGVAPGLERAALLLVGAIVGTQVLQWLVLFGPNVGPGSAVTVLAASKIPDDKLRTMEVSGVNFSRTTGKIQLQLQAEQR